MPDQRIVLDRDNLRLLAATMQACQPASLQPYVGLGWSLACDAVLQVADLMPDLYGVAPLGSADQPVVREVSGTAGRRPVADEGG